MIGGEGAAFVLGLAGVPGAGKTTLTRRLLGGFPDARIVYYDKYQPITQMSEAEVRAWFHGGADPNAFALAGLIEELATQKRTASGLRHKPLVVFETPFGRLHHKTGAFIDFLVWVDTPFDLALSRVILAFLEMVETNRAPGAAADFVRWQKQYLLNYETVRSMYLAQREALVASADLVLDGSLAPAVSFGTLRSALQARGIGDATV